MSQMSLIYVTLECGGFASARHRRLNVIKQLKLEVNRE